MNMPFGADMASPPCTLPLHSGRQRWTVEFDNANWPAPDFEDTELEVFIDVPHILGPPDLQDSRRAAMTGSTYFNDIRMIYGLDLHRPLLCPRVIRKTISIQRINHICCDALAIEQLTIARKTSASQLLSAR